MLTRASKRSDGGVIVMASGASSAIYYPRTERGTSHYYGWSLEVETLGAMGPNDLSSFQRLLMGESNAMALMTLRW